MNISEINHTIKKLEGEIKQEEITEEFFDSLRDYRGEDEIIISHQLKKEFDNEEEPAWEIKSNISGLDKIIGGFRAGELIVISAPTSAGKSKLTETFTINLSEQEIGVCYFSYEMTNRELLERFGKHLPIFYLPKKTLSSSLTWLEKKIIEALAKSTLNPDLPLRAIVIDHLHFLFDLSQVKQPSLELGAIVRLVKKIALKWGIVVFLIAHTNKIGRDAVIDMSNIRDSSFISQEADFVIMLERKLNKDGINDELYSKETKISVHKNRRTGKTGSFKVMLKNNKFEEIDENYEDNI